MNLQTSCPFLTQAWALRLTPAQIAALDTYMAG